MSEKRKVVVTVRSLSKELALDAKSGRPDGSCKGQNSRGSANCKGGSSGNSCSK